MKSASEINLATLMKICKSDDFFNTEALTCLPQINTCVVGWKDTEEDKGSTMMHAMQLHWW